MKKLKIKTTAYTYLSNSEFPQEFSGITDAIISQPDVFENIPIMPSVLEDAAKAMTETTSRAVKGGKTDLDRRDMQRHICESYLNVLSNFVLLRASMEATEEKQLAIINKSKFTPVTLTRIGSSVPISSLQVTGVKGDRTGKKGQILVRWKRIPGGISYDLEKAFTNPANPETIWHKAGSTSRTKITLDGFPELSRCWVRVIARGYGEKRSIPSNPAMCTIL